LLTHTTSGGRRGRARRTNHTVPSVTKSKQIDRYLDELLLTIDDFFSHVPGELRPDLYYVYRDVCRTRLEVRE
jgi:hypothetical protein